MAGLTDIVVGNFTQVLYSDDNTADPANLVDNVQSLTQPTDTKNIVEVPEYGQQYQRKLAGSSTTGDAEVVVNFDPSLDSHQALLGLYASGERRKFRIQVLDSSEQGANGSYYDFSGQVISKSASSEFDAVTTVTFSISVDGELGAWTALP